MLSGMVMPKALTMMFTGLPPVPNPGRLTPIVLTLWAGAYENRKKKKEI